MESRNPPCASVVADARAVPAEPSTMLKADTVAPLNGPLVALPLTMAGASPDTGDVSPLPPPHPGTKIMAAIDHASTRATAHLCGRCKAMSVLPCQTAIEGNQAQTAIRLTVHFCAVG